MLSTLTAIGISKISTAILTLPIVLNLGNVPYIDNVTELKMTEYAVYDNVQNLNSKDSKLTTYGMCIPQYKQICLSDKIEEESERKRVLYHEIGHVVDLKEDAKNIGAYSDTEEFMKECYNKERYSLNKYSKEYHFTEDPHEYFAECYSMYVLRQDQLKRNGENTYEFFKKIIGERDEKVSKEEIETHVKEIQKSREGTPMEILNIR